MYKNFVHFCCWSDLEYSELNANKIIMTLISLKELISFIIGEPKFQIFFNGYAICGL